MTKEKMVLRTDTSKLQTLMQESQNAISAIETLIGFCKQANIDVPPFETMRKIIESETDYDVVEDYANTLFKNIKTNALRNISQYEVVEALIGFTLGRVNRNYTWVEVVDCKPTLKEGAEKEMQDLCNTYVSGEQIERWERLKTLLNAVNELSDELREFNPHNFYTDSLFVRDEKGYLFPNNLINY